MVRLLQVIGAGGRLALFLRRLGLSQVAHKAKCFGRLHILGRYDTLDQIPGNHQLESRDIDWRNPDTGAMIRLRKPASHGKTAGRFCGTDVFIQIVLGRKEDRSFREELNHPRGL
jgi:hypothetical protein